MFDGSSATRTPQSCKLYPALSRCWTPWVSTVLVLGELRGPGVTAEAVHLSICPSSTVCQLNYGAGRGSG